MTVFWVGLRLALTADRVRLVVTSVAVAFTVAFLLAALGALPAREAKLERLEGRSAVQVGSMVAGTAQNPGGPRIAVATTYWRGEQVAVRRVVAGTGQPPPPGVARYPSPGELVVSPRLAEILSGPHQAELVSRLPGRVVGRISQAGLAGPDELVAFVGVTRFSAFDGADVPPVLSFGHSLTRVGTPPELRAAALLGAIGLLLPVLVLVATATRLSAASRDRRLSGLRLAGATPRQAAGVAAVDGLLAGLLGTAGGIGVFLLLRPLACSLLPYAEGVFAQDLRPPLPALLAVLVGVPLLAVATSLLSLRQVVTSPLGVRRLTRVHTATWWRLVPLTLGLLMLLVMQHQSQPPAHHVNTFLLLAGGGLTLVGLAVAAPAVSRLSARALDRAPGLSPTLAARRIDADPGASARVVTGMVLVVFVAAWLLAFLPLLETTRGTTLDDARAKSTLSGHLLNERADLAALRAIPGVRRVVTLGTASLAPPGWVTDNSADPDAARSQQVSVGTCVDVRAVIREGVHCGSGAFHVLAETDPAQALPTGRSLKVLDSHGRVIGRVSLPKPVTLGTDPGLRSVVHVGGLVQPSALPPVATRSFPTRVYITTDGSPSSVEAARAALPPNAAMSAMTAGEERGQVDRVYLGYLRAVRIGLLLALLVGAASLAVSTADAVHERRRSLAALVALGAPARLLRRTVLLQMAGPMLGNLAVALGSAAVASWCYLQTYDESVGLPWTGWLLTACGGLATVVLATAATLPLLRAVAQPEALRAE